MFFVGSYKKYEGKIKNDEGYMKKYEGNMEKYEGIMKILCSDLTNCFIGVSGSKDIALRRDVRLIVPH